jgi:H+/Cl- antiporter ClcA
MRRAEPNVLSLVMFLGGIAAIGTIFGNPFVTAFMILEFAAMGLAPKVILLPAFVALGAGYLTQIGWGAWAGIGTHGLSVPGLPDYPSVQPGDLLAGLILAIVVGIATCISREIGERTSLLGKRRPAATIMLAAIISAAVALAAVTWFDIEFDQILFSGQTGMASLITETSMTTLIVIICGKLAVYGVALGSGFRGGPIFPATFIGVACGALAALVLTDLSISAMAAVGIAAAATVMTRLPFTSALLAMLLVGVAGAAIAPFAIIGAVGGFVTRSAVDRLESRRASVPGAESPSPLAER